MVGIFAHVGTLCPVGILCPMTTIGVVVGHIVPGGHNVPRGHFVPEDNFYCCPWAQNTHGAQYAHVGKYAQHYMLIWCGVKYAHTF